MLLDTIFDSVFLKTDVSAVKILENLILASVGGFLNIYESNSKNIILKIRIFEGQNIYGIKTNSDLTKLIIYGGKNIAVVSNLEKCEELEIIGSKTLSDWILDAKWIENDTKIVTVFMRNKVTIWTKNIIPEISIKCEERCILYSAHICYDFYQQLVILSGTVFSEVLIWKPYLKSDEGISPVLKRLKQHKGVIFSICYDSSRGLICSTSDDRSAILWTVQNKELLPNLNLINCGQLEVLSSYQVYGHLSRVFRCLILSDSFVTAGEDSNLIIWNLKGEMIRKIKAYQGGSIWSLDYDTNKEIICTGGSNGGISIFTLKPNASTEKLSFPEEEIPSVLGILHSGNIVCLSESATLYLFQKSFRNWEEINKHSDLKSYSIMQISPCRRKVALAGFNGQIYIYYEKNNTLTKMYTYNLKLKTRIFSFHWLSCETFLVCQSEVQLCLCFLYKQKVIPVQTFILPPTKERWSTCACFVNTHIIVGDRKGNIFNFKLGKENVINSIKKSHNCLGITRIYSRDNTIISLGRDGILKRYKILNDNIQCIDTNKTKFSWLAALEDKYLLSFSGNNFVLSDCKYQRVLFEAHCGGGHRSWDYLNDSRTFTFCFIKNKVLNIIELILEDFIPRDIIVGYHVNEINCIQAIAFNNKKIIISGGADTVLRISLLQSNSLEVIESLKVHLSNIRSIFLHRVSEFQAKSEEIKYLLFTGGGRAQIICWHIYLKTNELDTVSVNCIEKYNFYEPLSQDEAETRIMDLSVIENDGQITLFSGCSDGSVKLYSVDAEMQLKYQKSLFCTPHSITKVVNISMNNESLLLAMNTNGTVMFWDESAIRNSGNVPLVGMHKIHQSGVNSYSYKIIKNMLLLLTGGDDNSVVLSLFKISECKNDFTVSKVSFCENKEFHCAQITGAYLTDTYFITSAIDQRIVLWKWTILNNTIDFHYVGKYNTAIADPQGLECVVEGGILNIYIYGIGIELLKVEIGCDSDCILSVSLNISD